MKTDPMDEYSGFPPPREDRSEGETTVDNIKIEQLLRNKQNARKQ